MILRDPRANYPLYRTLWTRDDGTTQLVCLQYPGMELFGTPYRVFVYDKNLRLLQSGELTAQQDYAPVAIVEVKAIGDDIPATRSGTWQLAIALAHWDVVFDPAKPIRLVGFRRPDDRANYVMCELITWHGNDDLTGRAGSLAELDSIEFRTAERNWRVRADGTVEIPSDTTQPAALESGVGSPTPGE